MTKRLFDVIVSFLALTFLMPIFVVVIILIRFKLGSPVFFRQKRPGLNGDLFELVKFRTMKDGVGLDGNHLPDEKRMTKFGSILRSTSLDELPELINVLKGDMSLVGPRPLLVEYLPLYSVSQMRRHDVKPGLTGWAQINGRNMLSWEDRFELDVWYVKNQSFFLDIKILFLTMLKVIAREGINEEGQATMTKFRGSRGGDCE